MHGVIEMKTPHATFWSDALVVLIIAAASFVAGLLVNLFRAEPLPLIYQPKKVRMALAVNEITVGEARSEIHAGHIADDISLEELRRIVTTGEAVIVDARPETFYRLGHVPGALSLPFKDFKSAYAKHRSRLEPDKATRIVVYCWGTSCEDSDLVRRALHGLGFSRVSVFHDGWSAWSSAGFPTERSQ